MVCEKVAISCGFKMRFLRTVYEQYHWQPFWLYVMAFK